MNSSNLGLQLVPNPKPHGGKMGRKRLKLKSNKYGKGQSKGLQGQHTPKRLGQFPQDILILEKKSRGCYKEALRVLAGKLTRLHFVASRVEVMVMVMGVVVMVTVMVMVMGVGVVMVAVVVLSVAAEVEG